jgi:hypothetical protein
MLSSHSLVVLFVVPQSTAVYRQLARDMEQAGVSVDDINKMEERVHPLVIELTSKRKPKKTDGRRSSPCSMAVLWAYLWKDRQSAPTRS